MKDVSIIIVGFGNIGQGLAKTLLAKKSYLKKHAGTGLRVVAVCEKKGRVVDEKGVDLKKLLEGRLRWGRHKTLDVIRDVAADVVVELTPGDIQTGQPGLSHINAALDSKKHVVTSNKSPIALEYKKLTEKAGAKGLKLLFEASVAGAIPVINTLSRELKANTCSNIYGILNGTTNFILSKMSEEGLDYETALKEAKTLGFAESDPSYDVEGVDSALKLVILANSLLGESISYADVSVEGILDVTPECIELAIKHGYTVKLVADVREKKVSPRLVPIGHPLDVSDNLNAILAQTDLSGEITLVGEGAGPVQTSSAIMTDLIEISNNL